ncbi:MAG TPA: calcium/sodium antiporter, partial [Chloroflexota bacterium]|nr:calcium/sodium antiporter [Chloroflexota bacterium]
MDNSTVVLFVLGLVLLIVGAEVLVRGASRLAVAVGITPLVIGLTVVAFGTSAPELAVSLQSTTTGQDAIAVGNAVGSNIFNILFVLGISAVVAPLVVAQQLVRFDVPLMIGVSFLFLFLALDGTISRLDGLVLVAGVIAYIVFVIRQSRRESAEIAAEYEQEFGTTEQSSAGRVVINVGLIVVGLVLLVLGSRWLVEGAVTIAQTFGVSELIIGLTIIAAGTSLPEVATSVIASLRGERDIAVGNAIGSNLFNILTVIGLTGVVTPAGVTVPSAVLSFDVPVMIAVAVACLPIFFTGYSIARWEGGLFLAYYLAYVLYLILNATEHAALAAYSTVMLAFVLPLTVLTLTV